MNHHRDHLIGGQVRYFPGATLQNATRRAGQVAIPELHGQFEDYGCYPDIRKLILAVRV